MVDSINLNLLIDRVDSGYRLRIVDSPLGGVNHIFNLNLDPATWASIEELTWREATDPRPLMEIGGALYDSLFEGHLSRLVGQIAERFPDATLRLRLLLADAPELTSLPWEMLYDRENRRFLGQDHRISIERTLQQKSTPRPFEDDGPLRILALLANPAGAFASLDVDSEFAILEEALADPIAAGHIELERLRRGTLQELREHLSRSDVHILHFSGHGYFDDEVGSGLVLEDESGQAVLVSGSQIAASLANAVSLRLVLLNACDSAGSSSRNPYLGVAQTLVNEGPPAAIAMQTEIAQGSSLLFSRAFYGGIAAGFSAGRSLTEARVALSSENSPEWVVPVFFHCTHKGGLFARRRAPAVIRRRAPFEPETIPIAAGAFLMGRDPKDPRMPGPPPEEEQPESEVTLPQFAIGVFPVTNQEFAYFVESSGTLVESLGQLGWRGQQPEEESWRLPVHGVTWFGALAYVRWLTERTGQDYRLPSEAEWEKAARGLDARLFPWGDEFEDERCRHSGEITPVDSYPIQSVYGGYDLVGNVREWTRTLWGSSRRMPDRVYRYPWQSDGRNDVGAGAHIRRVFRGGGREEDPALLTVTARAGYRPDRSGPPANLHGLRVVLYPESAA